MPAAPATTGDVEVVAPMPGALSRVNRVELIHTGTWDISTGRWTASREDLAAAVAALDCPAVRKPVLKLGHTADRDPVWAGNPTGEPAVGWVDNLSLTNDGHTLVGDFVGMPGWLGAQVDGGSVLSSAYPDRSVEGTYNYRCQLGHTHPFVLTAVALLGVTPPGVGTLRGLNDVARLYGVDPVTAAGPQPRAGVVVAHLPGRHNQKSHGNRRGVDIDWEDFGDFARVALTLDSGDTVDVDHTGQGAVIGFDADGARWETGPLSADDTVDLRNALRHGLGDGEGVSFGADGELFRDGDEYLLTIGDALITLSDDDREALGGVVDQAVTPRALVAAVDGDMLVTGGRDGDVTVAWDTGAGAERITLSREQAVDLADELDRLTSARVPDDADRDEPVDGAAVGPVDVDLFGSGDLVVSWDGDDGRVEARLGGPDAEQVRDALLAAAEDVDAERVVAHLPGRHERVAVFEGAREARRIVRAVDQILRRVDQPVAAAAEPAAADHTGAMVALLPSPRDAARLAVDGGEATDRLHVTLVNLGDPDQFDEATRDRLIAEVADLAQVIPPGEVDGFAVAAVNPGREAEGKHTAVVVELVGDGLGDVHDMVSDLVDGVAGEAGVDLPVRPEPWRPHITLAYTPDLTRVVAWADRVGPVRLDRIRVTFAGRQHDFPLSGGGLEVEADSRRPGSDRALRRYWLHGKGAARIRWNTPGDFTRCERLLRRYVRDPAGLCAVYHREATGMWTGEKRHLRMSTAAARRGFDPNQPRDRYGRWTDMHPATAAEIAEFRAKVGKSIPPGWTDVHIADDLDTASVLARGVDSKGRVHGIYSAEYTSNQAAVKFARVQRLNDHLDKLDFALERDAPTDDAAAALLLIRRLGLRPGSRRDTRARVQAYGATTLQARHVEIKDGVARLRFIGKEGVPNDHTISDPVVVDALARRLATRRDRDPLFDTTDRKVREYMRTTGGVPGEFLVKDLRTVRANVVALQEVNAYPEPPATKTEFVKRRREVAKKVAAALGNTPTVALTSYINPTVFTAWIKDPAWVNAAAAVLSRDEERRLLSGWFETVTFDHLPAGIPPVAPEPDDPDDET